MRKADNLPPYCAIVKKSGSFNFLDPSGPAWPVMGELYLLPLPAARLELTMGLKGTFGLLLYENHLNVMLCCNEEARFVSDHSEEQLCILKEVSVFFFSQL